MSRLIRATVLMATLLLAVNTAAAEVLQISEKVFANYQDYLKTIGATRRGAFAVGSDGYGSYYVYCEESNCLTQSLTQEALAKCQSLTGIDCVVMAYGREQRMEFTVVARRTALPPDNEILANVLPAERLKAYIVGSTMQGEYPNHRKWREYYAVDGTLRGQADEIGAFRGRYDFKGDAVCFYYDADSDWNWCARISIVDDKIYLLEDNELVTNEFNTEWLQGNPHGL